MAGRQRRKLHTGVNQDRTNALLRKRCEGCFEIALGSGIHNNEIGVLDASRSGD
jgi:hypothetical protein